MVRLKRKVCGPDSEHGDRAWEQLSHQEAKGSLADEIVHVQGGDPLATFPTARLTDLTLGRAASSACRSDCHIRAPKGEVRKRRARAGPRQLLRRVARPILGRVLSVDLRDHGKDFANSHE